ncbi:MAG: hypothetical protein A2086_03190 [Spirochaetes bacterium GWD1_27_9]|nr:MAG: hypothetical protein A2Y34_14170 [Spirochaetes bacterium GWC1_27_15]OHD38702.1 MAG: hypothetical protein A2086_03190 [Spirochaetes bacterium GWD1_27_9]
MDKNNYIWIEYNFDFGNKREPKQFLVLLDKKTLTAVPPEGSQESSWTHLDSHKCEICPLDSNEVKNCPIAYNISGVAYEFAEIYSIEEVKITVNIEERSYFKKDTVQQGLRSILGIYLATSGCPHMAILKPMARFHLPFASMEETLYRQVSNYLLGEYFEFLDGKTPDISLKELSKKNEKIDDVNQGICKRIESITEGDANKNALIILNAIGLMLSLEIQGKFDSLKYLYRTN